jgi:hypothetical protein
LGVGRWTNDSNPLKVIVTKPQRGGQGPTWAVEPYYDDDDDPNIKRPKSVFFPDMKDQDSHPYKETDINIVNKFYQKKKKTRNRNHQSDTSI